MSKHEPDNIVEIRVNPIERETILEALRLYGHVNDLDLNDLMELIKDATE